MERSFVKFVAIGALGVASVSRAQPSDFGVDLQDVAVLLDGDVRLLVLGDSFGRPLFQRVPTAMLRVWPVEYVSAIAGGAASNANLMQGLSFCEPIAAVDATGSYRVERNTSSDRWFGLPLSGIREIFTDTSFEIGTQDRFIEQRFFNGHMSSGEHGAFSQSGDRIRYRYLYWAPTNPSEMFDSISLSDAMEHRLTFDPRTEARKLLHLGETPDGAGRAARPAQVNASAADIVAQNDLDGRLKIRIQEGKDSAGTNRYVHPAGGVYYHVDDVGDRIPGLYYSYLSDNSWSFNGFGADEPSSASDPKRFRTEELTHWLDVTTLDRQQQLVVMVYLAVEDLDAVEMDERFRDIIQVVGDSCSAIGLTDVTYWLVTPHMHPVGSLGEEDARQRFLDHRDAAFGLAKERSDVSASSIYHMTDGVWFDGGGQSIDWLAQHGYDNFSYGSVSVDLTSDPILGDLLDETNLHPQGFDAAAFFAERLLQQVLAGRCPADLNQDQALDVFDVLEFLQQFDGQTSIGDWNVDQAFDIFDIIAFLDAFASGCP